LRIDDAVLSHFSNDHAMVAGGATILPYTTVGWQEEELFHINTGGFLLLPLDSVKCDIGRVPKTLRAAPVHHRNRTKRHIQPIGTKNNIQG
jgi:hypothetical protein